MPPDLSRRLIDEESRFDASEMFFSRTDKKGIILSGNSVFQRVSEYQWGDLLNRPHSLVRHPDMPRGVFKLFWDTIETDKPIGAFVKNCSRTGRYYWVFALALPIEGGYLSIRLKPQGALWEAARNEYVKLCRFEREKGAKPADSREELLKDLASLGFQNYDSFMTEALMQTIELRREQMKLPPLPVLNLLRQLLTSAKNMMQRVKEAEVSFTKSAYLPLNLVIQTHQSGSEAASLSVVAQRFETFIHEIRDKVVSFAQTSRNVERSVEDSQFRICSAVLQNDMVQIFSQETNVGSIDTKAEMNILAQYRDSDTQKSLSCLVEVKNSLDSFLRDCSELQSLVTGLEIIRITGRIETARLTKDVANFESLIQELAKFRAVISKSIKEIETAGATMEALIPEIAHEINLSTEAKTDL